MNRNLTALLGVLAMAGYQNRDKIQEILGKLVDNRQAAGGQPSESGGVGGTESGLGGLLGGLMKPGGLGDLFRGGSVGSVLSGGLGGLLDQFSQNGQGEVAGSWVKQGPNQPIDDRDLVQALGPELLAELQQKTGLDRDEIVSRLSKTLPDAVDSLTPDGTLPTSV
ncbi:YidB family protein [Rhizobium grahamii]|uniref:DUF937 domain-containing protein n=1 Tax=Rhizobium grahamii CCGE 502 TaxID=990285 RepID=S3HUT0_9HYPH|nr:YidB family protein [Rhizobium grahamii]EPE96951.1 hypothetical protein RGCCGE502_17665 [Rhizobium grahamii CCGE 502]